MAPSGLLLRSATVHQVNNTSPEIRLWYYFQFFFIKTPHMFRGKNKRQNFCINFQSRDLEDRETQEATMSVCMYVSVSQKIIRFKSMNSSVNSFLE